MCISVTKFIDQESFVVDNVLTPELITMAEKIAEGLIFNPIGTKQGIMPSLDKPLGSKEYMSNLTRPAVLRQFFGMTVPTGECAIYTYGTGSGSTTVGTHPDYECTREMTEGMKLIATHIQQKINQLEVLGLVQPTGINSFNHCTVLFYFHKTAQSSSKMLGFHTDNVYRSKGAYDRKKNSQMENTPTCILTIGSDRDLTLQKQYHARNPVTQRRKWTELFRRRVKLRHNSLFLLHASDERPTLFTKLLRFRWRHGVTSFRDKQALSIAFVYRTVINTSPLSEEECFRSAQSTTNDAPHPSIENLRTLFRQVFYRSES